MLTIIVPAYNEQNNIKSFVRVTEETLKDQMDYEILFVDDGSADDTWQEICRLSHEDEHVRGIGFSRNFGKDPAIFAGIKNAAGDCCVIIDCDLQHPVDKIPEMYALWEQGFDVVEGVKASRGEESGIHGFLAKRFYSIFSKGIGSDMSGASDFKLLDRKVMDQMNDIKEEGVFFRGISSWVGFRRSRVEYRVQERNDGVTKWSYWKLTKYAVSSITAYTTLPMQITTILGALVLLLGLGLSIEAVVRFAMGTAVPGFTTVIILLCFIGSAIMISLGIMGYYIARIFSAIQQRPPYIVSRFTGRAEATPAE